jgi:hypothetical protein
MPNTPERVERGGEVWPDTPTKGPRPTRKGTCEGSPRMHRTTVEAATAARAQRHRIHPARLKPSSRPRLS